MYDMDYLLYLLEPNVKLTIGDFYHWLLVWNTCLRKKPYSGGPVLGNILYMDMNMEQIYRMEANQSDIQDCVCHSYHLMPGQRPYLRIHIIVVLFPLVGWIIEGLETTHRYNRSMMIDGMPVAGPNLFLIKKHYWFTLLQGVQSSSSDSSMNFLR